jgi:cytochrome c oxidase subunit 2
MPVFLPLLLVASLLLPESAALAQAVGPDTPAAVGGQPTAWQLNFQPAASPVAERIEDLHDLLLFITVAISVFVLALLAYVCIRYRADRHPVPSRRTHNTVLGRQWYWSYEYPDNGGFTFDAYMIADEDLQEGQLRLFDVDNRVVLPVETDVRLLTTASDVLHSWAVPALGVKLDAVPGKINETWLRINRPGIYYGQCSELCGAYHAFMPVMIEAVSREEFDAWVQQAQEQFARAGGVDVADRQ